MACGCPVIVTIRFRVPGAKMPFFEICILAPDICWISIKLRPPGPKIICFRLCFFSFSDFLIYFQCDFDDGCMHVCSGVEKVRKKEKEREKRKKNLV